MVRVLLADDQVPDPARDARVLAEIEREKGAALRAAGKDPRVAWEEDRAWFTALIHCLENEFGFEVSSVGSFELAKERVRRRDFDAAIIDLSWSGDGDLPPGERSNVGFQLIDLIEPQKTGKPVIAFSQNFSGQLQLMQQATRRGALPLQKTYGAIDYQTLGSAILFLTSNERPAARAPAEPALRIAPTGSTPWDVIRDLPRPFLLAALPVVLLILLALAHLSAAPGEPVQLFGLTLYDRGW